MLGSTSLKYLSGAFKSHQCLTNVDPRAFCYAEHKYIEQLYPGVLLTLATSDLWVANMFCSTDVLWFRPIPCRRTRSTNARTFCKESVLWTICKQNQLWFFKNLFKTKIMKKCRRHINITNTILLISRPSDTTWCHGSWSTLIQVIPCHWTGPPFTNMF